MSGDFDKSRGAGWRKATVTYNAANRSTTNNYHGEIQYSGPHSRSTRFSASETVDWNNNLIWSWVIYETPIEQTFQCPKAGSITIKDVVMVCSELSDWSTGYFTTVTTAKGEPHRFVTSPFGTVTWYEHGYSFRRASSSRAQAGCPTTIVMESDRQRLHEIKAGVPRLGTIWGHRQDKNGTSTR